MPGREPLAPGGCPMRSSTLHPLAMRSLPSLAALACALSLGTSAASAQAPDTGPLVLVLPASTRATALGNAWVAGRDEDVIFYNPAQLLSARPGFNASIGRYGSSATLGSIAGVYAAGPLTMTTGWGIEFLDYSTRPGESYPFTPALLTRGGTVEAIGMLATVGTAITWKNFRGGIAAKYATDRVSVPSGPASGTVAGHDAFLGDVGIAHNLWTGIAGLSVQNIGRGWVDGGRRIDVPLQTSLGWTVTRPVGQLDLGVAAQVTARRGWVSPGGGVEIGYGWIEGYSAALRVGARRTETSAERPVALGATFNADRLSIEYALQFFEGDQNAHRVTIRWR